MHCVWYAVASRETSIAIVLWRFLLCRFRIRLLNHARTHTPIPHTAQTAKCIFEKRAYLALVAHILFSAHHHHHLCTSILSGVVVFPVYSSFYYFLSVRSGFVSLSLSVSLAQECAMLFQMCELRGAYMALVMVLFACRHSFIHSWLSFGNWHRIHLSGKWTALNAACSGIFRVNPIRWENSKTTFR